MKGTRQPRRPATNLARVGVSHTPALSAEALGPVVRELVGQLWESEQRHRMAFEQSPVGLAYSTLDGRFVSANEAWCALVGRSREQLASLSLADLAATDEFERHARLRRELLTGRIASYTFQTCRVRENGSALWLQFDVCLCRASGGEPLYLLSSVHDISALKALEERQALVQANYALERAALENARDELYAQAASLEQAKQAMEHFLSVASHELLTPLTIIRAASQLLSKRLRRRAQPAANGDSGAVDFGSETATDFATELELLGRVEAQVHALSRVLEDMAQVARVGVGRLELCVERLDLLTLVREVVAEQRLVHANRVIIYEDGCDAGAFGPAESEGAVWVLADGDRIRQVVANYLTNALKYSPAEAPVRVSVSVSVECGEVGSMDGAYPAEQTQRKVARIAVRDEGVGISPDEQPRVWERFHRAPGVRVHTREGANLGLGLYICKSIVERHEGDVGLSSAPGSGSTFWFSLPLAHDVP